VTQGIANSETNAFGAICLAVHKSNLCVEQIDGVVGAL
jgi:hypothetical protein